MKKNKNTKLADLFKDDVVPTRVRNTLGVLGIETVGDLEAHSYEEIIKTYNFGKMAMQQLVKLMIKHDIQFSLPNPNKVKPFEVWMSVHPFEISVTGTAAYRDLSRTSKAMVLEKAIAELSNELVRVKN